MSFSRRFEYSPSSVTTSRGNATLSVLFAFPDQAAPDSNVTSSAGAIVRMKKSNAVEGMLVIAKRQQSRCGGRVAHVETRMQVSFSVRVARIIRIRLRRLHSQANPGCAPASACRLAALQSCGSRGGD